MVILLLLLLVAAKTVDSKSRVLQFSGRREYDGIYIESKGHNYFKRMGSQPYSNKYDELEGNRYIWHDGTYWYVGNGATFKEASSWVWAEGEIQHAPPFSEWTTTSIFYRQASMYPKVRVVELPSLVSTRSQTVTEGGSFTVDGGVVCEENIEVASRKILPGWMYIKSTSEMICNKMVECKQQWDERLCFEKKMNQQTQTIILNGVGKSLAAGVYSLQKWHDIEFYARMGKHWFIYQPKSEQGLVIASGEHVWSASAIYKSEGQTRDLTKTVWRSVSDGDLAPEVQLTMTPNEIDPSLLENKTHFEKETIIPGVGIICLGFKTQEKTLVFFNESAIGWCDKTWHCQLGGSFSIHVDIRYSPETLRPPQICSSARTIAIKYWEMIFRLQNATKILK